MDRRIEMSQYVSDGQGRIVSLTSASLQIEGEKEDSQAGDCFDPDTCCDERERLLIQELRDYLRPQSAPACLVERLRQMFNQLDDESAQDDETQI